MKQLSFFLATIFLACVILACTGNSSATNDKQSSTTATSDASGSSGSDMFYEYKLNSSGRGINIQGDTKMYMSSKGDMRVEMSTTTSFKGNNSSVPIVTIGHADKPNESISIDDSAKTYSINHFNDSDLINTGEKMNVKSVSKIGNEKILGYSSVHARVIVEKSIGGFYSDVDTIDLWRSNEVPFLASIKDLFDKFEAKAGNAMYPPSVSAQLKQMGCDGFMTKMEIRSKNSSTTEELVKVEHRDLSAGMFQVPPGYTETKESL